MNEDLVKLNSAIHRACNNSKYAIAYGFIPIFNGDAVEVILEDLSINEIVISSGEEFICHPRAFISDEEKVSVTKDIKLELSCLGYNNVNITVV